MASLLRKIPSTFLAASLSLATATGLIDPEPNPFADALPQEQVLEATVQHLDPENLVVTSATGAKFFGKFSEIVKYRSGGGPAAANEFFVSDQLRILANAENKILAAQNYELQFTTNLLGFILETQPTHFILEDLNQQKFQINLGPKTEFRNDTSQRLFGYKPRIGEVIRPHGILNQNQNVIFTETFGAYLAILPTETLTSLSPQAAQRLAETLARPNPNPADFVPPASPTFPDVPPNHKFFTAIEFLHANQTFAGYPDGTFQPAQRINRAEFTKILINTKLTAELAEFSLTESCFPDFELSAWFAKFVCLAKTQALLAGYPDGTFQPANPVNLAEAAKITTNVFGFKIDQTDGTWFQPALDFLVAKGIWSAELSANPARAITRGEFAELIFQAEKHSP